MHKVPPDTLQVHIKIYFQNLYGFQHTYIKEQSIWKKNTIILLYVTCQWFILGPGIDVNK